MAADGAIVVDNPIDICHRISKDNTRAIRNFNAVSIDADHVT